MYLQSRNKRWLGVLQRVRAELQHAKRTVDMYADAARPMSEAGVRVIRERDQQVMTALSRDALTLTFESQRLASDSWLADALNDVAQALNQFAFGDQFVASLDRLIPAVEDAIQLLQERSTEPDQSIDEIVDEMERAFLISLVVTLTSHNVLLQKVSAWEQPHQRFLNGHLSEDVGHYFDVKTLCYVDSGGPGRIHMQDLVSAIDAGANLITVAGHESIDHYPEVQAVFYAQWFTYAFALWEEQFRGRIAAYFDQRSEGRLRRSDVLNDYFGDIRLIRNDFVHNKGICNESAGLKLLQWGFVRGQPIQITAEQMMSLVDLFPRDQLRMPPTPQPPGVMQRVPGKVDPHLLEDVLRRRQEIGLTNDQILNAALTEWLEASRSS